ncbi:hypothetical protein Acr_21g0000350 [Actinidia rufa]|uniref:Uncharacterized protein n=1 Tax=Actinidia rufa TaxID=165716 RepID=A0A7J0GF55_9ERIC|nr:hypothetical protein Acr_21g0000350 [Actinidia rufa]
MALPPDYEYLRASLLHRHPLPTVGQALAELRSEETRKKTMIYQHFHPVLATPVWAPLQPPSQSARSKRKEYHNRQTAAITDSSGLSPDSSSSTLTASDVETIVTQDSWTEKIIGTDRKVGRLFELKSLHACHAPVKPRPGHVSKQLNAEKSN